MANYPINKGIDKTVEFKGLRAQYLGFLFGGLGVVFLVVVIMFIVGLNPYVTVFFALLAGTGVLMGVFSMNSKYGRHGLLKIIAKSSRPKYIIVRKSIYSIFKNQKMR